MTGWVGQNLNNPRGTTGGEFFVTSQTHQKQYTIKVVTHFRVLQWVPLYTF